jgi:hypothetical protein
VDRRFAGGTVMVLILVAILCVPAVVGRSVWGSAAPAVHVDSRPEPGNCLAPLQTPDQLNSVFDVVPPVPCSTPHSAEVLAVGTLDPRTWPNRPKVGDAAFTGGALSQRCDQLAGRFLGWGVKNALPRINVSFFTRLTVPGDVEWKLGQRWYSCELMPGVLDFPISYRGTARNASTGTPPGAFANCSEGPGELAVSCDRPHHAELLTRSYSRVAPTADYCRRLVSSVIGTADPTFGGQLALLARGDSGVSSCWVTTTSSRSLTETLINHGPGPLPLT